MDSPKVIDSAVTRSTADRSVWGAAGSGACLNPRGTAGVPALADYKASVRGGGGDRQANSPEGYGYFHHLAASLAGCDRSIRGPGMSLEKPLLLHVARMVFESLRPAEKIPACTSGIGIDLDMGPSFKFPSGLAGHRPVFDEEVYLGYVRRRDGDSDPDVKEASEEAGASCTWKLNCPNNLTIPLSRDRLAYCCRKNGQLEWLLAALERQRTDDTHVRALLPIALALRPDKLLGSAPSPELEAVTQHMYLVTAEIVRKWRWTIGHKADLALRVVLQHALCLGYSTTTYGSALLGPDRLPNEGHHVYLYNMLGDFALDVMEDRLEERMKFCTCETAQRALNHADFRDPVPTPPWLKLGGSETDVSCTYMRGHLYTWWANLVRKSRFRMTCEAGVWMYREGSGDTLLSLMQSLLQMKKAFPDISVSKLASSTDGWFPALSEPRRDPPVGPATYLCLPGEVSTATGLSDTPSFTETHHVADVEWPGLTHVVKVVHKAGDSGYTVRADRSRFRGVPDGTPHITPRVTAPQTRMPTSYASIEHELVPIMREIVSEATRCSRGGPVEVVPVPGIKATYESSRGDGGTMAVYSSALQGVSDICREIIDSLQWCELGSGAGACGAAWCVSSVRSDGAGEYELVDAPVACHGWLRELKDRAVQADLAMRTSVYSVPIASFATAGPTERREWSLDGLLPASVLDFFRSSVVANLASGLKVVPQALPEPFKVRLISKGPALCYWVSRVMQAHVLHTISALPEFELIRLNGSRSISEVMNEVLGTPALGPHPDVCPEHELFAVSGDYKASTDNLSPHVTRLAIDAFGDAHGYSAFQRKLLHDTLVGHVLVRQRSVDTAEAVDEWVRLGSPWPLPDTASDNLRAWAAGDGSVATHYQQNWGQLMGSCTSFPFLCMGNLALSLHGLRKAEASVPLVDQRWAQGAPWLPPIVRKDRRTWPSTHLFGGRVPRDPTRGNALPGRPVGRSGLIVNGDDIIFLSIRRGIASWRHSTTAGGLSPSVGKNYVSDTFGNVNSTMFSLGLMCFDPAPLEADSFRVETPTEGPSRPPVRAWLHVPYVNLAVLVPPQKMTYDDFRVMAPGLQRAFVYAEAGSSHGSRRPQAARPGWSVSGLVDRDWLCTWWLRCARAYLTGAMPDGLMNWFAPRQLGGFGLVATRPVVYTEFQRRAADWLVSHQSADGFLGASVDYSPDDPMRYTSVRADSELVERSLTCPDGPLERVVLAEDDIPLSNLPSYPRLGQLLAMSGFSSHVVPDGARHGRLVTRDDLAAQLAGAPPDVGTVRRLKRLLRRVDDLAKTNRSTYSMTFRSLQLVLSGPYAGTFDDQPRVVEVPGQSFVSTSVASLRKAATSTGRMMDPESIYRYVDRRVVTRIKEGWWQSSFHGPVSADARTGRLVIDATPLTDEELAESWRLRPVACPGLPIRLHKLMQPGGQLLLCDGPYSIPSDGTFGLELLFGPPDAF